MTSKQIRQLFAPGRAVAVTNHFINRPDHPCFGTNRRTIAKVSSSHLWFSVSPISNVPWPKASDLRENPDGSVSFYGFPAPDALFLTFRFEEEQP